MNAVAALTPEAMARIIGRTAEKYSISLSELRAAFPARPTTEAEYMAVAKWMQAQYETELAKEAIRQEMLKGTKTVAVDPKPTHPTPSQAPVNLATYRQTPGKKVKAIRYALRDEDGTVKFYRVKPGYKPGFFFVDVQASDDLYPIKNYGAKTAILARIANDPDAALALYGQELGSCGHCGRTLTSEYRKLGIGPVCINK
jgi:hypothetical protein